MPNFEANLWHRVKKCDILGKLGNSALYRQPRRVRILNCISCCSSSLGWQEKSRECVLANGYGK